MDSNSVVCASTAFCLIFCSHEASGCPFSNISQRVIAHFERLLLQACCLVVISVTGFRRKKKQIVKKVGAMHVEPRSVLLGATDGLITSFVIVIGGIVSNTQPSSIIAIGWASLFADGISMGVSEALSVRSHDDYEARHVAFLGVSCFISFVLFGTLPLGYYTAMHWLDMHITIYIVYAIGLLLIAVLRVHIANTRWCMTVGEVAILGTLAGSTAFAVAYLAK